MSAIRDLLGRLRAREVRLWADGEALRFSAPPGAMTADLLAELKSHKAPMLELLASKSASDEPIHACRDGSPAPLSFSQQRLWFLRRLDGDRAVYNVPSAHRVRGPLGTSALEQSLAEIRRRHQVLRTVIREVDETPTQMRATASMPMLRIDLSRLPAERREQVAQQVLDQGARRAFDLEHGPLLRSFLIDLGPTDRILGLCLHHIVADGWSVGLLQTEMTNGLDAYSTGRPAASPPLPIQYTDFARWQRSDGTAKRFERQLDFWRQHLQGAPESLDLPRLEHRHEAGSAAGYRSIQLDSQQVTHLEDRCRALGTTLYSGLLAAFVALLARSSRQDDLVIGTPIANRNRRETEALVGFFTNTLALRLELQGGSTLAGLTRHVGRTVVAAQDHQDVPFERVIEAVRPERSLDRNPLFQVMFAFQNRLGVERALPTSELSFEPLPLVNGEAKFDLTLSLEQTAAGVRGHLEYEAGLFEPSTIEALAAGFLNVVETLARQPEQRIDDLELVGEQQHRLEASVWNQELRPRAAAETAGDVRRMTVADRIVEHARRQPDAVALEWRGGALTYRTMVVEAQALARELRNRGVGPEVAVGVYTVRAPETLIAVLAIHLAGGVLVPIDPAYPAERRAFLERDCGLTLILASRECEAAQDSATALLWLERGRPYAAGRPAVSTHHRPALPDQLAYIVYTSGSTGEPKGVAIPDRTLRNLAFWQAGQTDPPPRGTLQFAPMSFDVFMQETFSTWVEGGALHLISDEIRRDPVELLRLLHETAVERMFLPFVALQQLAEEAAAIGMPPTLRHLYTAGEQLQMTPAIRAVLSRNVTTLDNHYGPSETHLATFHPLRGEPADWPHLPSIGRPIEGARAHVTSGFLRLSSPGLDGELVLGGDILGRGYVHRPAQTAARFLPDPFGARPGDRLYRSGDLCRRSDDGSLQFLGRIDHQVKIRGYRVEPGEIEATLMDFPGITQAVVVPKRDSTTGPYLVAYVVSKSSRPDEEELARHLRGLLPEYMLPKAFVLLEEFPKTPSGKINRRALPDPGPRSPQDRSRAPRDPLESLLVDLWREILDVPTLGIDDDFFDLGGHSLLAARLLSRIRGRTGAEVSLRDLFECPTIAALSRQLRQNERAAVTPITTASDGDRRRLSFAQERMWTLERMSAGTSNHSMPAALRLHGRLHLESLHQSLVEIVRRHESLRTTFHDERGTPVQLVATASRPALRLIDLSASGAGLQTRWIERLIDEEIRKPFDLATGPLLRLCLVRCSARDHVLIVVMHHIISDGWSVDVITTELSALYGAFVTALPSPLSELEVQYADYSHWQRQQVGGVLEGQLEYWCHRLTGAPPLAPLPLDRPRPTVPSLRSDCIELQLDTDLTTRLQERTREHGASLYMALLAAFSCLLYRYTGNEDQIIACPVANRSHPQVEPLIGTFANVVALRLDLTGDPSFDELLGRTRKTAIEAYSHQDLPFDLVVGNLLPERQPHRHPIAQVAMTLQSKTRSRLRLGDLDLEPYSTYAGHLGYDLLMALEEHDRGIAGSLAYDSDLFDPSTIIEMRDRFLLLLEVLADRPEQRLLDVDFGLPQAPAPPPETLAGDLVEAFRF
ncbi:MAG: amino acid adenylation domain-containing protein [Thermoanaerobaculia bacterium]|nr:amino acid adenylation domain-containing protein [Thermoanaerobaculia bacterium]